MIDATRMLGLLDELVRAKDLATLERVYFRLVRRYVDMPMFGIYLFGSSGQIERAAAEGVSDLFLSRYEDVRAVDFLLDHAVTELEPAGPDMFLSVDQWRHHELFEHAHYLHDMVSVIQAPILSGEQPIGTVNFGSDGRRGQPTPLEREMAAALGRLLGIAVETVRMRRLADDAQRKLVAVLDASPTPVAVTDLEQGERHLNASAAQILGRVDGGETWIDRLTSPSGQDSTTPGEADVPLLSGGSARLSVHTRALEEFPSTQISLLHLAGAGAGPAVPPMQLCRLTARQREIAVLVADGLRDRDIADRLFLSPHTVREYVKIIYRKLGVSSRVALTRLVLDADRVEAP